MVRLLVVGPLANFNDSVVKLKKLNAKSGPFEFCLLLFPPSHLPDEDLPVPTYFVATSFEDDNAPRHVGRQLNYMGSFVNESIHGLRLLMCSDDDSTNTILTNLKSKGSDFLDVDLMVTHCGPKDSTEGSDAVSRLGTIAKPRYHFFGAHIFRAYDPFQAKTANYATRVISVGGSGRWVYAADVAPLQGMSKSDRLSTLPQKPGEVLYMSRQLKRTRERKHENTTVKKRLHRDCWFCLSNKVEGHLVVTVGETVYVALAKGGINDSHLVIVPVAHVAGSTSEEVSDEMILEIERFSKAIRQYYSVSKKSEAMIFEWCGEAEMMHMCVQTIAIRKEVCGLLARVCAETANRFGVELKVEAGKGGLREARRRRARECFWAELPGGQLAVAKFEDKKKLPANFGRVVVAQALGILHRAEWRKCVLPKAEEEALTEKVDYELAKYLNTTMNALRT